MSISGEYTYNIKAIGEHGNLSQPSDDYITTGINEKNIFIPFQINISNNHINISQKVDIRIYSITGALLKSLKNKNYVDMNDLNKGIFLIKFENKEGVSIVRKVLI